MQELRLLPSQINRLLKNGPQHRRRKSPGTSSENHRKQCSELVLTRHARIELSPALRATSSVVKKKLPTGGADYDGHDRMLHPHRSVRSLSMLDVQDRNRMKSKIPAHYKSLSLGNFRGFKKADRIPLAPLTFLVGPNSSGKSSIYDALLLLTQSDVLLTDEPRLVPTWIDPLVDLGSFEDTVFDHKTSLTIKIAVDLSLASSIGNGEILHSNRTPIT